MLTFVIVLQFICLLNNIRKIILMIPAAGFFMLMFSIIIC